MRSHKSRSQDELAQRSGKLQHLLRMCLCESGILTWDKKLHAAFLANWQYILEKSARPAAKLSSNKPAGAQSRDDTASSSRGIARTRQSQESQFVMQPAASGKRRSQVGSGIHVTTAPARTLSLLPGIGHRAGMSGGRTPCSGPS